MKVSNILATKNPEIITIHPQQTIKDVVALLDKYNIGALVVVDDENHIAGIISERDVIRQLARNDDPLSLSVQGVMTKEVITGMPQDDLISVANTMTEKRFRHLPIVENNKLIGMISIGDIIKAQRDEFQGQMNTLEAQILSDRE